MIKWENNDSYSDLNKVDDTRERYSSKKEPYDREEHYARRERSDVDRYDDQLVMNVGNVPPQRSQPFPNNRNVSPQRDQDFQNSRNVSSQSNQPFINNIYTQEHPYQSKSSGLSISSMVLGIISLLTCCFGWVGMILSILAVIFAGASMSCKMGGKGMAIAGLVCGIVALIPSIIFIMTVGSILSLGLR